MALSKTVAAKLILWRRLLEERISALWCAYPDGSEKFKMMIISSLRKPRVFKKRSGEELGLDYKPNNNAWMNSVLFYNWLVRFDDYTGGARNWHVALLTDSWSILGKSETIPALQNVEVVFLPPNTTSKVEPVNAGVVASVKTRYCSAQMERVVDSIDEDIRNIYKVDILSPMRIDAHFVSDPKKYCWALLEVHRNIFAARWISKFITFAGDCLSQFRHRASKSCTTNVWSRSY